MATGTIRKQLEYELIWTNPSPKAEFTQQDLSGVNPAGYRYFLVLSSHDITGTYVQTITSFAKNDTAIDGISVILIASTWAYSSNNVSNRTRTIEIHPDKLRVNNCNVNQTNQDNHFNVPRYIYGII